MQGLPEHRVQRQKMAGHREEAASAEPESSWYPARQSPEAGVQVVPRAEAAQCTKPSSSI